jgi:hypothetical protein
MTKNVLFCIYPGVDFFSWLHSQVRGPDGEYAFPPADSPLRELGGLFFDDNLPPEEVHADGPDSDAAFNEIQEDMRINYAIRRQRKTVHWMRSQRQEPVEEAAID